MKSNSKLVTGLLIGAAAGVALALLANTDQGKKVIEDIKDASGKAEKDLKKALSKFEDRLSEGKEYIGKLEKKAGKFVKSYTN
ncbi:MAG: YtxH domain-containing protein [Chitinophagaceae bacterium]